MKIGYRIGVIAMALICIVVLFFAPVVRWAAETLIATGAGFLGQAFGDANMLEIIQNNDGNLPEYYKEQYAIFDFFNPDSETLIPMIKSIASSSDGEMSPALKQLMAPAITFVVALVCVFACAIAVIVTAFTKNNRRVIYSAIAGIGSTVLVSECFTAISNPILNGEITLSDILNNSMGDLLGTVIILEIGPAFWVTTAIFAAIILFTVGYNYTLSPKDKLARKKMLGEE